MKGGIIYGYCISRSITRKTTVVHFKLCVTAPEIATFSVSVLRIALGSVITVVSFLAKTMVAYPRNHTLSFHTGELSSTFSGAHGRDASIELRHSIVEPSAPAVKHKCTRDEDITTQG